jgi:phosphomevalonate kinase
MESRRQKLDRQQQASNHLRKVTKVPCVKDYVYPEIEINYRGSQTGIQMMSSSAKQREAGPMEENELSLSDIELMRNVLSQIEKSGLSDKELLKSNVLQNQTDAHPYKLRLLIEMATRMQELFQIRLNKINVESSSTSAALSNKMFLISQAVENAGKIK